MKTRPLATLAVVLILLSPFGANHSLAQSTNPSIPVGFLTANPTVVQAGTKPNLTWSIVYPSTISGLVEVNPPGTLIPREPVYVTVQIVGATPTTCGTTQGTTPLYTEARLSLNHGTYLQLFYGTQAEVNPTAQLYIKKVNAGTTIDFGGRFVKNGAWSPFYTTLSANFQVVALVNGQTPPTSFSLYRSNNLANFLRPYLNASGKVDIGPLSVLILMELGQTNRSSPCYDYQDMVLLVSFSTKHPNNGNGNNLDGVDSSNPGRGHGGPNGLVDLAGGVDDETK